MNDWISVKERLPKEREPVQCFFSDEDQEVLFQVAGLWYTNMGFHYSSIAVVTHWQLLPEPPKE